MGYIFAPDFDATCDRAGTDPMWTRKAVSTLPIPSWASLLGLIHGRKRSALDGVFLCFFLMFFVMLDGCVSKLVEPDNSPVDLLYSNHECLRQLAEGTEKHQPECPQAQQTLIESEQQKREDAKNLSKHGWLWIKIEI